MDQQAKTWAAVCHLAAFAGFLFPFGGNIIGPLIVWLIKKNDHPFIDDQGKEALNFQISMVIWGAIGFVFTILTLGLGVIALIALGIAEFIFVVIAAIQASNGVAYRYPLTFRFIQ